MYGVLCGMCGVSDMCSVGVAYVVFIWYVVCVSRMCYLWLGGIYRICGMCIVYMVCLHGVHCVFGMLYVGVGGMWSVCCVYMSSVLYMHNIYDMCTCIQCVNAMCGGWIRMGFLWCVCI